MEFLWKTLKIKLNYYLLFGDFACLRAAVQNGADSVYLGASSFNARANATNFNDAELYEAIKYAKLRNVKVHLTLNTLIKNEEFENALKLAIQAYNLGVDAIIIQDLGLASYILKNYPQIPLHASTQMTVHNLEGVKQLENLGFSRVVLSRELSIKAIKNIKNNTSIELEVFIHGALCISYSGQCLLSSMIGSRSGNRGTCAQPCRLKYDLIEENKNTQKTIDSGYLLSPKDNMGLLYLPELINMGIHSLKIEGRMKTPIYVATVTKIYRKYIDFIYNNPKLSINEQKEAINKMLYIKNENTGLSDYEELLQVFNRGGFETGHFNPNGNNNLIYKNKPNNMGIYLGTISHINENKGYITFKTENQISISDKVSINNNLYNVSELMINNKNYESIKSGNTVTIGRMKGNLHVGMKIYKLEDSKLNKNTSITFDGNKNFKKIPINGKLIFKANTPITLKIWSDSLFYKNLEYIATSSLSPEKAINKSITKEDILKQIQKTGNTEFEFNNLNIDLDDGLFIQNSVLNELRRTAISGLENLVIKNNTHDLNFKLNKIIKSNTNTKSITLLLNTINPLYEYNGLNINKLYIPLKYFYNIKYNSILKELTNTYKTYIYLPNIIKDSNKTNFDKIIETHNITGFVISNISEIELVSKYNLELIGNYTLNTYNNYSIEFLNSLGLKSCTISPELQTLDINNISGNFETIVYGKIPVMTNNYCYLGKTNKCNSTCSKKCLLEENNYYLKDRTNSKYRIIPDNSTTITTIYNHTPLKINSSVLENKNLRIDILDETPQEIKNIIKKINE